MTVSFSAVVVETSVQEGLEEMSFGDSEAQEHAHGSGGSKGGARDARPLGVEILSILCSFSENLAKSYVGAPLGELALPPRANPGSATAWICRLQKSNRFLVH